MNADALLAPGTAMQLPARHAIAGPVKGTTGAYRASASRATVTRVR